MSYIKLKFFALDEVSYTDQTIRIVVATPSPLSVVWEYKPSASEEERKTYDYTHFSDVVGMACRAAVAAVVKSKRIAIQRGCFDMRGIVQSLDRDFERLWKKFSVAFRGIGLEQ